jgi:hypothetical protein
LSLYEMLNNNECYGFYDLDYYHGCAGDNSANNSPEGALWVDIDAGQIDGENDRKRDICLYP